jgi:hypothetical protein
MGLVWTSDRPTKPGWYWRKERVVPGEMYWAPDTGEPFDTAPQVVEFVPHAIFGVIVNGIDHVGARAKYAGPISVPRDDDDDLDSGYYA